MGKFNNLTCQCDKFLGAVLQFVEQRHRLFLGEMATEFLHNLVVVVANHSVLRVKRGKLGVVFHQRLVLTQHLERLAKDLIATKFASSVTPASSGERHGWCICGVANLANNKKNRCEYFAKRNKFHIFAATVSTTLPIDQRTRVELLLFIRV